jgi:hypothetical protein
LGTDDLVNGFLGRAMGRGREDNCPQLSDPRSRSLWVNDGQRMIYRKELDEYNVVIYVNYSTVGVSLLQVQSWNTSAYAYAKDQLHIFLGFSYI